MNFQLNLPGEEGDNKRTSSLTYLGKSGIINGLQT